MFYIAVIIGVPIIAFIYISFYLKKRKSKEDNHD